MKRAGCPCVECSIDLQLTSNPEVGRVVEKEFPLNLVCPASLQALFFPHVHFLHELVGLRSLDISVGFVIGYQFVWWMSTRSRRNHSLCSFRSGQGLVFNALNWKMNPNAVVQSIISWELKHAGLVLWHFIGVYFMMWWWWCNLFLINYIPFQLATLLAHWFS